MKPSRDTDIIRMTFLIAIPSEGRRGRDSAGQTSVDALTRHASGHPVVWRPMAVSRNLVRPSDVGKRVTFQYELPNGYVSEAVGVLEAWDDAANTYLVRTKDG